jgi:hypothetical protein
MLMARITEDTNIGSVFTIRPKVISWERLWTFSGGPFRRAFNSETGAIIGGWPVKNIHTDLEFAKSCGLPKVAASATQYEGYTVQLMINVFGPDWLTNGHLDVKFPNLVDAGDVIASQATVTEKDIQDNIVRFRMDISLENQRQEKVGVGWAYGYLGKTKPRGEEEYMARIDELKNDKDITQHKQLREMSSLEYIVTPELNQQFCYGEEDYNPIYLEETEYGLPLANPGLILNFSNATRSPSYVRGGPGREGGVHTADECFWYNQARVGKKIKVMWTGDFLGSYERRGRSYSISTILVVDEDGRNIVRRLSRSALAATPEQPYKKHE